MSEVGALGPMAPSTVPGPEVVSTEEALARTVQQSAPASDIVARSAASASSSVALAYAEFRAAPESGIHSELTQRYGIALVRLIAALPIAMRNEFLARLAAASSRLPQAGEQTGKAGAARVQAAVAGAVRASVVGAADAGATDAGTSLSAARLAQFVARDGIDSVIGYFSSPPSAEASGKPLPQPAAYALMPQVPSSDAREKRHHDDRRRRREPERHEEVEPQEKPGYTIDDIVRFAGVTLTERRTPPERFVEL